MNINTENYLKSCRICLQVESKIKYVDIFTTTLNKEDFLVSDALQILVNEQLTFDSSDSNLPSFICLDCLTKVKNAYNVVQQIISSARTLESYKLYRLQSLKIEDDILEVVDSVKAGENAQQYEEEFEVLNEEESDIDDPDYTVDKDDDQEYDDDDMELEVTEGEIEKERNDGDYYVVQEVKLEESDEDSKQEPTDAINFLLNSVIPEKKSQPKKRRSQIQQTRNHRCDVCEKTFLRKSNLVDHLRLHANVKLFSCEVCQKAFVQAGNLKIHMRIHTQDKPFACKICGNKYTQSSALKTHMKIHTNTKDFVCVMCGKGFTNSSDMKKHTLIHSDIKNFQCLVCPSKYFTQKIHLKNHLKSQHPKHNLEDLLENGSLKKSK